MDIADINGRMFKVVGLFVLLLSWTTAMPIVTTLSTDILIPLNSSTAPDGEHRTLLPRQTRSTTTSAYTSILKFRQLYCRNGYHLQIMQDGTISGTKRNHDQNAIVIIISIRLPSTVAIQGVMTGKYLAMSRKGVLYTSDVLTEDCHFREDLLETMYNTYSSATHPTRKKSPEKRRKDKDSRRRRKKHRRRKARKNWYVALDQQGQPRLGSKSRAKQKMAQFLPRPVDPSKVPAISQSSVWQSYVESGLL